mgnify:CR=1 FL=1
MAVLEYSLQLAGPDDDALVGAAAREPLPVPSIVHAVHRVLQRESR